MSFLWWGLQSWMQDSRWGLTRAEQRGRITFLDLLVTIPGYGWLSGLRAHTDRSCWASCQPAPPSPSPYGCSQTINTAQPVFSSVSSTGTPKSFLAGLLSSNPNNSMTLSYNHRITDWKRPRRSSSPTIHPTPPFLLNHILKCHIINN